MMLKHAAFVTLDFAWGNGESLWRVARSVMIIVVLFVVYLASYSIPLSDAVRGALGLFFGTDVGDIAPPQIVWVAAVLSRYVLLGGFMTVLVKRLARR